MATDYIVLEIEFFSHVNDSMIKVLMKAGMSNALIGPDGNALTSGKRFARVIEKSDRSLRQDIIEDATALLDAFDKLQNVSAILWDRPFSKEGLTEKQSTPRKLYAKGVISHELSRKELDRFLQFQLISNNRVMIFGDEAFFVYDLEKNILLKKIKCSFPKKFIEINGNGYLFKSFHKLLFSYDAKTFKKNPSLPKLKAHVEDVHQYDDEHLILASGKNVYLLNIKTQEFNLIYTHQYINGNSSIKELCLSKDREFLLVYCPTKDCEYNTVIWNIQKKKEHLRANWAFLYSFPAVYISQNSLVSNAFARSSSNPDLKNKFYTLELNDGKSMEWIPGGYEVIGFSSTGKYTVANNQHEVELRDPDTDKVLFKSEPFVEDIVSIRFSDDDKQIGVVTTGHFFLLDLPG